MPDRTWFTGAGLGSVVHRPAGTRYAAAALDARGELLVDPRNLGRR